MITPLIAVCFVLAPGLTPQAADLVFDHVFTVVQDVTPVRGVFAEVGFTVTVDETVHEGQGTASHGVLFDNGYIELIWIRDAEELRAAEPTLAERLTGPDPASPFGLGMALRPGVVEVPFETREYRPSYLPPEVAIEFGSTRADEPAVFVFPWEVSFVGAVAGRPPYTESAPHGNGSRRITAVRFHRRRSDESRAFESAVETELVETVQADATWLEVEVDEGRTGRQLDLRPSVGLVVRH